MIETFTFVSWVCFMGVTILAVANGPACETTIIGFGSGEHIYGSIVFLVLAITGSLFIAARENSKLVKRSIELEEKNEMLEARLRINR